MKTKFQISNFKFLISDTGFTFVEIVIVIGIVLTLLSIGAISLLNTQNKTNLNTTINTFITDLKEQQTKAMVGDAGNESAASDYGVHFASNSYTVFRGTYSANNSTNFTPSFPSAIQITTTFSGGDLIFIKGSGETTAGTITFTNTNNNEQKTVMVNRYGVITGIN